MISRPGWVSGQPPGNHRRREQVHVLDMIGVGLVEESWVEQLEPQLAIRFQALLGW